MVVELSDYVIGPTLADAAMVDVVHRRSGDEPAIGLVERMFDVASAEARRMAVAGRRMVYAGERTGENFPFRTVLGETVGKSFEDGLDLTPGQVTHLQVSSLKALEEIKLGSIRLEDCVPGSDAERIAWGTTRGDRELGRKTVEQALDNGLDGIAWPSRPNHSLTCFAIYLGHRSVAQVFDVVLSTPVADNTAAHRTLRSIAATSGRTFRPQ